MKKVITIAAVGLALWGLGLGRAAAEHHGFFCTPCGPVGQCNAFSPVYKEACCPYCGHAHHPGHCHFTQCNAFSPLVEDCSKHHWFSWLHHDCQPKADVCCPPNSCDWGCLGELPDGGSCRADSGMKIFPHDAVPAHPTMVVPAQPNVQGAQPMPSSPSTNRLAPSSPEPFKASTPK